MKKKDVAELKTKSHEELKKILSETRTKLHGMKVELHAGKIKNTSEVKEVRKTIARVLTFMKAAQKDSATQ